MDSSVRRQLLIGALAIAAALALRATGLGAMANPAAPSAANLAIAAGPDPAQAALRAEIAAQIEPLLPEGARLDGIELHCKLRPDAKVSRVAPGVTRLTAPGFVLELATDHGAQICSASAEAQRPVLIASRDLALNSPVTAADLETGWVDAFTGAPAALTVFPAGAAMVASAAIARGNPIYPNQIAAPIAIRPGDQVTVTVRNGAITLRTILESRASASIGQSATLLSASGTPVAATVTGPDMAELVMQ